MKRNGAFIGLLAVLAGVVTLFSGDAKLGRIQVVDQSGTMEKHLRKLKQAAGDDYEGYRGHCYRVLSYTLHLLDGDETHREELEAALAFHDAGLWTEHNLR